VFTHSRKVLLRETDVTGVIYFTSVLQYAMEAFENYLQEHVGGLSSLFSLGYFFPIVHVEADLSSPLRVSDDIMVELKLDHIGNTSFTLTSVIWHMPHHILAGKTKIVHATLPKGAVKASCVPEEVRTMLLQLK